MAKNIVDLYKESIDKRIKEIDKVLAARHPKNWNDASKELPHCSILVVGYSREYGYGLYMFDIVTNQWGKDWDESAFKAQWRMLTTIKDHYILCDNVEYWAYIPSMPERN